MHSHDDQNLWNFVFSVLFVILVVLSIWTLFRVHGELPVSIALFDLILIILATFRLIRLFVYDKVTRFVRDWFVAKREVVLDTGLMTVERVSHDRGPWRTISDLLGCPWCFGVWVALAVTFFYFLTPLAWYPILFLAVAGVASLLQLLANLIGWSAEKGKTEVHQLKGE